MQRAESSVQPAPTVKAKSMYGTWKDEDIEAILAAREKQKAEMAANCKW
jgi:hypothetical protein